MGSMLVLAVIIIAVSGLIAYIGDLVGRKMGRKRLTLMGLRPRHTAIIISVVAGMLIATLTLATVIAVNKGVQKAFFTPISALQDKLAATKVAQEEALDEIQRTRRDYDEARRRLDEETRTLANTERQLTLSQRQRAHIRTELSGAQASLRQAQEHLTDAQQSLQATLQRLVVVQAASRKVIRERDAAVQASVAQLTKNARELQALEDKRLTLEGDVESLQGKVNSLNERVAMLKELAQISFSSLTFTSGQEILSGVFPTGGSESVRRALLTKFLHVAELVVRQRSPEMARDATAMFFLEDINARPTPVTAEQAVVSLSQRITNMAGEPQVILRLAPVNNVPVNGPAIIALKSVELQSNSRVFWPKTTVASLELSITEQTTRAEVLSRVVDDLLRVRVPAALRAHDVVMLTRRFDPDHPDTVPETSYSLVPWSDLLAVVDRACTIRGPVTIQARTRASVMRSGPVDLTFEVVAGRP
jgi:hypothetical protein